MYKSDIKRGEIISNTITNPQANPEKRIDSSKMFREGRSVMVTYDSTSDTFIYRELLNKSFWVGMYAKVENQDKPNTTVITNFIRQRLSKLFVDNDLSIESFNYENDILKITLYKENDELSELFDSLEEAQFLNVLYESDKENEPTRADKVQIEKHRDRHNNNVKRVDMLLKTVFTEKFEGKYKINTDVGKWVCERGIRKGGKLTIVWINEETPMYKIHTTLFPNDTNKVIVKVFDNSGKVVASRDIETYIIPVHPEEIETFFRKILFNELKRYIDSEIIKLEPFNEKYVFWDAENPDYPYSFSTPSRNKIILSLIHFINVARKPKLNDFFERNNLKHKQGYLQVLLDSAEDAGIFKFHREGNEVYVEKGKNYRDFLKGNIRKI